MSTVDKVRALLDREAEASLDRGETEQQWLEALEAIRRLLDEEIAAARFGVKADAATEEGGQ